MLTMEKKILLPLLQGFEPVTFQLRVWHSNHWAIPTPRKIPVAHWTWDDRAVIATWTNRNKGIVVVRVETSWECAPVNMYQTSSILIWFCWHVLPLAGMVGTQLQIFPSVDRSPPIEESFLRWEKCAEYFPGLGGWEDRFLSFGQNWDFRNWSLGSVF